MLPTLERTLAAADSGASVEKRWSMSNGSTAPCYRAGVGSSGTARDHPTAVRA